MRLDAIRPRSDAAGVLCQAQEHREAAPPAAVRLMVTTTFSAVGKGGSGVRRDATYRQRGLFIDLDVCSPDQSG